MKKLVSIILLFSIICSSCQIVFATDYNNMFNSAIGIMNYSAAQNASREAKEAKEAIKKQTGLEQLNNNNKPSYFVQLRSFDGGLLSIDMAIIVASEFKKHYDKGWFEDKYDNVIIFRDVFDNIYVSEQFSSQEKGERELKRITDEYNSVLLDYYRTN